MLILNLSRGNNGLRVPLRLPATPADIGSAYVKLDQISEEIAETRIAGVVTEVGFLDRFFRGKTIEDYSDLNELAKRVNSMTEQELHTYDGALNAESINDVSDLLRIADSLNRYIFINGITTEKELGQFLVDSGYKAFPESVKPYLDYAAIGAEYYAEHGGAFTAEGYTLYRSRAESLSPEENEWWKPIFRVLLQTTERWDQEQEPYVLELPATTEQLFAARSWLDVADIDHAEIVQAECLSPQLAPNIPLQEAIFSQLQDLSVNLSAAIDNFGESLVFAVFDMKKPQDFMQACSLALEIWRYELITDVESYGRNALFELCEDQEIVDTVDGFIDWHAFGLHMLEEDGQIPTDYGFVRSIDPEEPNMGQVMYSG